ncbi:family 5 exo-beta-1,3-glucanase glycosyl hydrolase [Rhizodiscina lignyota]|uniref:glucan 1,3-beta-glucosidase n=1 Tax=Rhizodiscina lignyota TaxID=1504668 RepID=A0A9P4IEK9_9PEZI|nr:family 5 exo-beta-1,3-glucanase glycosyl hydrolase [Rhizodiscina lignyota]
MKQRGGAGPSEPPYNEPWWKRRKKWIIGGVIFIIVLIVAIVVGVVVSQNKSSPVESQAAADTPKPKNSNLNGVSEDNYPKGTYYDPFTWFDTADFNITYTDQLVGGLPIMGLNSSWNDDVQCNPTVPALKDTFEYGKMPIRGINIGGWLSIEPFITPSFFQHYDSHDNVIDEWTLTTALGSSRAAQTLEQHYSAFVDFQTFVDIRNAGFDHVRIPFSYWAVTTYEGDPYVPKISWRYLLRAIEWARQNGLRVNLDLHGIPGSQNGWNHSGRQGVVGWLNGTDGTLNAQRSIDIHDQLSTFFAQPRYKNLITMYGLVNEPRMVELNTADVLNWTTTAIKTIRGNGIDAVIVFGDGFMGLDNWQGKLTNEQNLLLDVHQYVIFNVDQLTLSHSDKLNFACKGWTAQMKRSMDTSTGFGPTMCGEWSQADTDCALYLNDVGIGSRWQGTLNTGNASTSVLSPVCPTNNNPQCECNDANADPSDYSDAYKKWLLDFAEAQMDSFEQGWGWFYWTWDTEQSPQWSYKKGMAAGILPQKAYQRTFHCTQSVPDFAGMGLAENY